MSSHGHLELCMSDINYNQLSQRERSQLYYPELFATLYPQASSSTDIKLPTQV